MHAGKLVFSQLMEFLPWRRFDTCVRRYRGDRKIKSFPCSEHWRVMAFAQLTYRESLRDIETCLRSVEPKLYHMGFRQPVSWATQADVNFGSILEREILCRTRSGAHDERRAHPAGARPDHRLV